MEIMFDFIRTEMDLWTSRIGAKSVFLNISRDIVKNTPMAPLREVHSLKSVSDLNWKNIAEPKTEDSF